MDNQKVKEVALTLMTIGVYQIVKNFWSNDQIEIFEAREIQNLQKMEEFVEKYEKTYGEEIKIKKY